MTDQVMPCSVLVDSEARTGHSNMQQDEALLHKVTTDDRQAYVRIYRWSEPTVSLGYFQKMDDSIDPRIAECDRVKRITGGGAILHDQELTYSCIVPATHPVRSNPIQLYERVHTAIIELLRSMGVAASLRSDVPNGTETATANEPFLCFLRSDPRDVVFEGHKIVGSAQRRRRGTILQHGSILLRASPLTPEVVGICDLASGFDQSLFSQQLPERVGRAISTSIDVRIIRDQE